MALALYRKWRPRTFSDVDGQQAITEILRHEVAAGKQAHAYLFTGSRGTGKTTCAKILAKAVNCLHPRDGEPCLECENCRGIEDGSILDVVEIDAASNNGVDNIRQLKEESAFTPAQAKYRVYIIDETHMLSAGAFNALLKIMEEPPPHLIFILATTEVHKVPATILSRCQRFDFRRITAEVIADRMERIAAAEGGSIDRDAALLIGRIADGGMRDAVSLLDQCLSIAKTIDTGVVTRAAGLADRGYLFDLTESILRHDTAGVLRLIDQLYRLSVDFSRLTEELIGHFRTLMILKNVGNPDGLILLLPEERVRFEGMAKLAAPALLLHALDRLQETLFRLTRTSQKRVEVEMSLLQLCNPSLDTTPEAILRRVEALEAGQALRPAPAPAAAAETATIPPEEAMPAAEMEGPPPEREMVFHPADKPPAAPPPAAPTASPARKEGKPVDFVKLDCWPEVLATLARTNPALYGTLGESACYVGGDLALIDSGDRMFFQLIRSNDYAKKSLRAAIEQHTGRKYRLGPYRPEPKTEEAKPDRLGELLGRARAAGIPVHEE